jgi:ribosome-binding protein aMBF1 (putative translation factor)
VFELHVYMTHGHMKVFEPQIKMTHGHANVFGLRVYLTHGHMKVFEPRIDAAHGHRRGSDEGEMTRRGSMDRDAARFGAIVRRLRQAKGWNLIQFGRKADMNPTYLGRLERGENTPSLICILHLAKVLDAEAWTIVAEIEGL